MSEKVIRVVRKWGLAVVGLTLLTCPAPSARAQADSPRLLEAAEKVRGRISERMSRWERRPVTPMQPSRNVSVDLWSAGRMAVKVSVLLHASPEAAAEGLEGLRYHTEIEEQAAKSRGRSNYPSIIEEVPALGDEEVTVSEPHRASIAFRKGAFSVGVSMERGDTAPDPNLIREFAVLAAQALPDGVRGYSREGLPPYGNYVRHPVSELVVYYLAIRPEKLKPRAAGDNGLYESKDGGRTWALLSSEFKFRHLFIHPETGGLFAVVDYNWPPVGGVGGVNEFRKVIRSNDSQWRVIAGGDKPLREGVYIFNDPDNAGRVCLYIHDGMRGYVLQATDDNYTRWNSYLDVLWWEKHGGSR